MAVTRVEQGSKGHGNTALVYHARRLMALEEGDVPFQLRIACSGLIETLGQVTYDGQLQHAFTAHPKVDAKTGECTESSKVRPRACWMLDILA